MRLLILCAVLSVLLAVSFASPIKTDIRNDPDSSESAESSEPKTFEKNSSSSEEQKQQVLVNNNNEENNSADCSEEQSDNNIIVKEDSNEDSSVSEDDNKILNAKHFGRSKRAIDFIPHNSNQLKVKDEGSIKYEKYLKLKRLKRALDSDEPKDFQGTPPHKVLRQERSVKSSEEDSSEEKHADNGVVVSPKPDTAPAETLELAAKPAAAPAETEAKPVDIRRRRNTRSAESSDENSSEENKENKTDAAHVHSEVTAKKHDTADAETSEPAAKPNAVPAENESKSEGARRRRTIEVSSEEETTLDQDLNEVFVFSNENQQDFEQHEKNDHLQDNEYVIADDKYFENSQLSFENNNSEEDYAQGCGGSSGNHSNDSNENSNENNETLIDKL